MYSIFAIPKLVRDTYILPYLSSKAAQKLVGKYDYAFLVHARSKEDFDRHFPPLKFISKKLYSRIISNFGPVLVSDIVGMSDSHGEQKKGLLIAVLATPEILYEKKEKMREKILLATQIAAKLGAKVIGLGALTASVTSRGKYLASRVNNIGITTGHAFTTVTVVNNLLYILSKSEIERKKLVVAIVGAAGSIGSACFRLLNRHGFKKFILIDKKIDLLNQLMSKQDNIIQLTDDVGVVENADIIITATNAPYAIIKSHMVKPGTIVLDDAQPSDMDISLEKRDDVLSVEAGITRLPGLNCNFNFGLLYRDDVFGCLGETILLTWHGHDGHYVIDDVSDQHLLEVEEMSKHVGFAQAEIRGFKRVYHDEEIGQVLKLLIQRHK